MSMPIPDVSAGATEAHPMSQTPRALLALSTVPLLLADHPRGQQDCEKSLKETHPITGSLTVTKLSV